MKTIPADLRPAIDAAMRHNTNPLLAADIAAAVEANDLRAAWHACARHTVAWPGNSASMRAAQALQDLLHPDAPIVSRDPVDYIRHHARHPDDME